MATLACDSGLRITNQTVYEWLPGHPPHPSRAMALVEMSGGSLSLEAIYQHGQKVRTYNPSFRAEYLKACLTNA